MHIPKNQGKYIPESTFGLEPGGHVGKSQPAPAFQLQASTLAGGGGEHPLNSQVNFPDSSKKSLMDSTDFAAKLPSEPTAINWQEASQQEIIDAFFAAIPWAAALSSGGVIGLTHFIQPESLDQFPMNRQIDGEIQVTDGLPIQVRLEIWATSLDETFDLKEVQTQMGEPIASSSIAPIIITDCENLMDKEGEIQGRMEESETQLFTPYHLLFVGDQGGMIRITSENISQGKLDNISIRETDGMRLAPYVKSEANKGFESGEDYFRVAEKFGGEVSPARKVEEGQRMNLSERH